MNKVILNFEGEQYELTTQAAPKSDMTTKTYCAKVNGVFRVVSGTLCSPGYCRELGCDFPKCATFAEEEFSTLDDAKKVYPDLELI